MCPPTFYGVEYEINAWMNKRERPDHALAQRQWEQLRDLVAGLGARVELVDPVIGLPDLVFTANAGIVHHDLFITSQFRHPQRQPESAHFDRWFVDHGYRVASLPVRCDFEGAGDALFCGEQLYAGYLHRSNIVSHRSLARSLECEVLSLELVDGRFYHLDTCFCPLDAKSALYYPAAFDEYGRAVLREHIPRLIEVCDHDAHRFGCNAVVVGTNVVFNAGCAQLSRQLEGAGYTPHQTDLSEFLKSGGAAKCLTLRLDGEQAAVWAHPA